MAQYAYNNAKNKKTKMMPFFANYSYNPTITGPYPKESLSLVTMKNVKRLKGLHNQLKNNAEFLNLSMRMYYNRKYKDMPPWKKGDKVYL